MFQRAYCISYLVFLLLSGCCCYRPSESYLEAYAHLEGPIPFCKEIQEPDYYVVFLVKARHFDYENSSTLLTTMVKTPTDGYKDGSVGHAWILLHGIEEGQSVVTEGGHSGELGVVQPKYAEGVMNYLQYGYLDPTKEQMRCPRYEPNPIKYLWAVQKDGHFETHIHHQPTFAAMVPLTEQQYYRVKEFIDPKNYPYHEYAITRNQCSNFVAKVGVLIDFPIEHEITFPVEQRMCFMGRTVQVWKDPIYSEITLSAPDVVEKSLLQSVRSGEAIYALDWYFAKYPKRKEHPITRHFEDFCRLPDRVHRLIF